MNNKWYAVHLDLTGWRCVLVGGGQIATRRMNGLVEAGAKVTVISPQCHPDIHRLAREGAIDIFSRNYEGEMDLTEADMVFAATNDETVNWLVARDANKLQIPFNNAGDSKTSTFIIPAVLKRGQLMITVSTSGASPGLAKRIRDELLDHYEDDYESYVDFLAELRDWVHAKVTDERIRAMIFQQVLKLDILELIRTDKLQEFRSWLLTLLEEEARHEDDWKQRFEAYSNHI